jgi:probable phosphoglycerate mutase
VHLLLIRHGQTPSNVAGKLDTAAPGPGLTELGYRQAARIPQALENRPIDGIFVSILERTHLTAAPLALERGLEPVERSGLHEIEAGALEMLRDPVSVRTYMETAFAWGSGKLDTRMPGGTNGHAFFERFDADIAEIDSRVGTGTAVVVSHGAAIRVWSAGRATNVPPAFAGQHELDNTGVVELRGSPIEGWTLVSWQGTPVGGVELADAAGEGPMGESLGHHLIDDA